MKLRAALLSLLAVLAWAVPVFASTRCSMSGGAVCCCKQGCDAGDGARLQRAPCCSTSKAAPASPAAAGASQDDGRAPLPSAISTGRPALAVRTTELMRAHDRPLARATAPPYLLNSSLLL